ncbi:ABC transporter substrate-binding protein [Psychrobacter sp. I-STPA6b]|uniref:ABC transporter substrate-binding protein n=1 Tax=Psychrobacter sp. I-STPA6b TaxID=2585718 RepID=UPI001D0C1D54|nr:ABC transporter substrate-binding protein [Psychrobacter sp. I-STPA6b]
MKFAKHRKRGVMLLSIAFIMVISIYLHWSHYQKVEQLDNTKQLKVFTPDWGVGATLVAMSHPPIAIGDKKKYPTWVDNPKLPKQMVDLGTRGQPNVELLAQLHPNLILDTFYYKENRAVYDPSIPVYDIDFGIEDNKAGQEKTWTPFIKATQKIGMLLNNPQQAQHYIDNSKQRIIKAGKIVRQHIGNKKVLVVSFWDARQLDIKTKNSHTTLALKTMGLNILDIDGGTRWGVTSVPMHILFELPDDICLIIEEPIPEMVKYDFAHSPLWQHTPFFRPDACVYTIDPVWSNGGIEVLVTFAENLEKAVTSQQQNEFSNKYATQNSSNSSSKKGGE